MQLQRYHFTMVYMMLTNQNDTIALAVQFYWTVTAKNSALRRAAKNALVVQYLHDRTYMISIFSCLVLLQTAAKNQVMDNIHLIHALKFDSDTRWSHMICSNSYNNQLQLKSMQTYLQTPAATVYSNGAQWLWLWIGLWTGPYRSTGPWLQTARFDLRGIRAVTWN